MDDVVGVLVLARSCWLHLLTSLGLLELVVCTSLACTRRYTTQLTVSHD